MSAGVAMLHIHGVTVLPPPRRAPVVRRPLVHGPATDRPLFPTPERLADVQPVAEEPVRNAGKGRLWNEFVACYHCYLTLPGAQHFVRAAGSEPLAVLGFGAAAWKIAPQDKLVGPETRRHNLPLVINNARGRGFESKTSQTSRTLALVSPARRLGRPLRVAPGRDLLRACART